MSNIYDIDGNVITNTSQAMTFRRNNLSLVTEFLTVAQTYLGKTDIEYKDGNTPIYVTTQTNGIDCSTYVMFCMLGIPYSMSPYATGVYGGPSALSANTADYDWAMNPMKYTTSRYIDGHDSSEMVRLACQFGHWMFDRGQEVSVNDGFADVRPGDIVFWGHKVQETGEWLRSTWWRHINHVGIVLSKEDAPNTYVDGNGVTQTWDKEKYPYKHTIIDVGNTTPTCRTTHWLEEGQEDATNVYANNVNTIQLICRPDIGGLS